MIYYIFKNTNQFQISKTPHFDDTFMNVWCTYVSIKGNGNEKDRNECFRIIIYLKKWFTMPKRLIFKE